MKSHIDVRKILKIKQCAPVPYKIPNLKMKFFGGKIEEWRMTLTKNKESGINLVKKKWYGIHFEKVRDKKLITDPDFYSGLIQLLLWHWPNKLLNRISYLDLDMDVIIGNNKYPQLDILSCWNFGTMYWILYIEST